MPQARHPSLFRQLPAPLTVRCNDLFCALANPTGPRHSAGVHLPRHYARLRTRGRRPLYQIQFGMAAIAYSLVTAGNVWLLPDHATWLQTPYVRIATVVAGIVALLIFFRLDYEPRLWRLYLKDRVIVTPGTYRHPTFVALAYFLIEHHLVKLSHHLTGAEAAEIAATLARGAVRVLLGERGEVGAGVELRLELLDLGLGFFLAARGSRAVGAFVHEQDVRCANGGHGLRASMRAFSCQLSAFSFLTS